MDLQRKEENVKRWIAASMGVIAVAAFAQAPKPAAPPPKPVSMADLLKDSPASDWRDLDPDDTMYIELPAGRVIIELAPSYAPENAAAVRKLVREKYFDGSSVIRSQDNYVVQWARPEGDPLGKKMEGVKVKAEFSRPMDAKLPFTRLNYPDTYAPEVGFSGGFPVARDPAKKLTWLVHCYGSVGVGRDMAPDSGNGAELYAVIGQSPRGLDKNITVVGRVIRGIELFSVMPRGSGTMGFYEKPEQYIPIKSVRLASEVPAAERVPLEALKTESRTFRTLIENRANRRDEWFVDPIGKMGVCNMALPVRDKKS
jgi:cyclophilin family peptidyl-prolyl cis-trans isomerase